MIQNQVIFKAGKRRDAATIVGAVIIAAFIFGLLVNTMLAIGYALLIAVFIFLLGLYFLTTELQEITLDHGENNFILFYENTYAMTKTKTYGLNDIKFTYRIRRVARRSGLKNVCTIYHNEKVIACLIPGYGNWDDNLLHSLVSGMEAAGIKRKQI